jgi:hypothetical protein
MLDRTCAGQPADFLEEPLALGLVRAAGANLDQLVAAQSVINFREHRRRKPVAADDHDRPQAMRAGFEFAAL